MTDVSCPTDAQCWASGISHAATSGSNAIVVNLEHTEGMIASSADGGQTWRSAPLPQGVLAVVDISCPSDTNCYALALQRQSQAGTWVLLAYRS